MAQSTRFDPTKVEVWRHLLASVAEEMGATLERTAFSPNIKERLDHSCAIFDASGRLLVQAAHIPVHLGAMPLMMRALLKMVTFDPGVMWLCNDPRVGGTHLPDLTVASTVYSEKQTGRRQPTLIGYVASRAHRADVGGSTPGSLSLSRELFHEGLILPPVRLVANGEPVEEIVRLVCANSRTPPERRGDLAAQIAANETGAKRLRLLRERAGAKEFRLRTSESIACAEMAIRSTLNELPNGAYDGLDSLDDDGVGSDPIPIRVRTTVRDGTITFDFTGSTPQVAGSLNATEAITRSACYYVVRCLGEEEIRTNEGCFAPIEVIAPKGTVVNARFPAAVAAGNVETSQRIVDVLLRSLAQAAPNRIPAASQGTMNNLTIGGFDPFREAPFANYETIAGGAGATANADGARHPHPHDEHPQHSNRKPGKPLSVARTRIWHSSRLRRRRSSSRRRRPRSKPDAACACPCLTCRRAPQAPAIRPQRLQ